MDAILTGHLPAVKTPWSTRSFCPRASTLLGVHKTLPIKRLVPIRCKCWSCDYCAPINAERLKERIMSGRPNKFITLTTVCQAQETIQALCKRVRPQISRLMCLIRQEFGSFEAAIVLELTKKGMPHYHLICRSGYIRQHWLSDQWSKLTGAKIVDIRKLHNIKHAISYVAKYTTKTARATAQAKLGRVYSFTSGYLMREQTNPPEQPWSFSRIKEHPLEVLRKWPEGRQIHYHDGVFDLVASEPQVTLTLPESPRPPPASSLAAFTLSWCVS